MPPWSRVFFKWLHFPPLAFQFLPKIFGALLHLPFVSLVDPLFPKSVLAVSRISPRAL